MSRTCVLIETRHAMHGLAIVPDHQIPLPPLVRIDELPLRRVFDQIAQEGARLRHRPTHDGAAMRRQEQRFPSGHRMHAHQSLTHRPEHRLLVRGQLGEAQRTAREHQRMFADQVFDFGLRRIVQRVVGGAHVGEFGVSAVVNHDPPGQQRILRRYRAIRTVRMPQPVAEVEHPPPVVARQTASGPCPDWTRPACRVAGVVRCGLVM